ncbi:MAG: peptide chain release factor-like protein [Candidatus Omnitrophota bacterium]
MRSPILKKVLANLERETRVIFYKSTGPGGQRKNKKETSVKLYHIPSGLKVIATESRSQANNKKLSFRRLKKKLSEFYKRKKKRIPTSMPRVIKEDVLKRKKLRSEKKKFRKKVEIPADY